MHKNNLKIKKPPNISLAAHFNKFTYTFTRKDSFLPGLLIFDILFF